MKNKNRDKTEASKIKENFDQIYRKSKSHSFGTKVISGVFLAVVVGHLIVRSLYFFMFELRFFYPSRSVVFIHNDADTVKNIIVFDYKYDGTQATKSANDKIVSKICDRIKTKTTDGCYYQYRITSKHKWHVDSFSINDFHKFR